MADGVIIDPPPSTPPALPPYPELIFAAIAAVDAINGANKKAISKHIEEAYGPMPEVHYTLLSHHLNRMKKSGELIVRQNKFVKFDPNAPRRGRGRPSKPKSSPQPGADVSSPKPRGRPSKTVNPVETVPSSTTAPPEAEVSSPRPRGRPPKTVNPVGTVPSSMTVRPDAVVSPPRPRGRPPKNVNPVETVPLSVTVPESEMLSPRPRGRPPKTVNPVVAVALPTKESSAVSGRKRGRPSKTLKTTGEAPKVAAPPSGSSRGRGRPPKVKAAATASVGA